MEQGTHQQLLQNEHGVYRNMWTTQNENSWNAGTGTGAISSPTSSSTSAKAILDGNSYLVALINIINYIHTYIHTYCDIVMGYVSHFICTEYVLIILAPRSLYSFFRRRQAESVHGWRRAVLFRRRRRVVLPWEPDLACTVALGIDAMTLK